MISFIYFDLGGVVIKDFSGTDKWVQFFKDCNFTPDYWAENEQKFNRGMSLPKANLVSKLVNRFEKNETIWPVLKLAKEKFKIGLLTNMYPGMFEEIQKKGLLPDVAWNVVVNSSFEHVGKPDRKIYEIAQEKCGYKKDEILFVENTQENLLVPKELGWQTFWYDPKVYETSSQNLYNLLTNEN